MLDGHAGRLLFYFTYLLVTLIIELHERRYFMKQFRKLVLRLFVLASTLFVIQACEVSNVTLNDQLDKIGGVSYLYEQDGSTYEVTNLNEQYEFKITSTTDTLHGYLIQEGLYIAYNDESYRLINKDSSYYDAYLTDIFLIDLDAFRDSNFKESLGTYQIDELNFLKSNLTASNVSINFDEENLNEVTAKIANEVITFTFKTYEGITSAILDKQPFEVFSYEDNQTIQGLPLISYAYFNELTETQVSLVTLGEKNYTFYDHLSFFSTLSFMDSVTFIHKKTSGDPLFRPFESGVVGVIEAPIYDINDVFNQTLVIGSLINTTLSIDEIGSDYLIITKLEQSIQIKFDESELSLLDQFKKGDIIAFSLLLVKSSDTLIYDEQSSYVINYQGEIEKVTTLPSVKDVSKSLGLTTGLPSTGNPKMLVLPIAFTNYTAPYQMVSNLEKVLFGTKEQTGYHSLQSYYLASSYGNLSIDGDVLEPFVAPNTSGYYERDYKNGNEYVDYDLLEMALNYHNNRVDYSQYDSDNDGYIDSIMMVYTAPVSFNSGSDLWWAYTYQYESSPVKYFDGVKADYYIFMGYDFIDEVVNDNVYLELNALTFIHETGHLLGLDDYYDYDLNKGPAGGIGGSDMMDATVGDHNPYSKLLLGWIDPYVTNGEDLTLTLKPYVSSGDVLIIPKNPLNSVFQEYLIIDFYTPTGLYQLQQGYNGLFTLPGIRIYHVNSTLNTTSNIYNMWSIPRQNNTDTTVKLLKLLEADMRNDIESTLNSDYGEYSENSDLFQVGSHLSNYRWSDGSYLNLTFNIHSITANGVDLTVDFQ